MQIKPKEISWHMPQVIFMFQRIEKWEGIVTDFTKTQTES